jgi:glycosyltransferase involved in cell wall biosynthesis
VLRRAEAEYEAATAILCPSDFVVQTFRDHGFAPSKLVRHIYGYDETEYFPDDGACATAEGLRVLYVGVAAVRKGLHFALDAWLASPASQSGTLSIAGEMLPAYGEYLGERLRHPSVRVLGHRDDVPELMRTSDLLVLPSIEEGFGLVCTDAMGSGCVPLVSVACTDLCRHGENALIHEIGDVKGLEEHLTLVHKDRQLLARLRAECLRTAPSFTWTAAGERLLNAYREMLAAEADRSADAEVAAST